MSTQTTTPTSPDGAEVGQQARVRRQRAGLLFLAITVPSLLALPGGVLWPEASSGDWYVYADIAPIRDRWWLVVSVMAVGFVPAVLGQALATLMLTPRRGAAWSTAGAAVVWSGAALQVVGVAGWAMTYYFATDPGLDPATATSLLDRIGDDPRVFALGVPGAVLVAVGTVIQAVGLLRSRTLPVWIPVLTLGVAVSFFAPATGFPGLLVQVPISASSIAIGWYAWRRA